MKFKIYGGQEANDYFIIESDDIKEIQQLAKEGAEKRGWDEPWSKEIK